MNLLILLIMTLLGFDLTAGDENREEQRFPRPLQYVSTDKPLYRRGEIVRIRDIILDGMTNYPLDRFVEEELDFTLKILGPRGDQIYTNDLDLTNSTSGLNWQVPKDAVGGTYTIRIESSIRYVNHKYGAPAERKFEVLAYRVPRIKSQIEFLKRGYLPGEECTAVLHFERAEGGVPQHAKVSASAIVDGAEIYAEDALSVTDGTAIARFKLPENIKIGDGTIAFTITDGGTVESAGKTLPILLDNYQVNFYPEGGDLIYGVPQRVYIEALRKDGKGADITGEIINPHNMTVCKFTTQHDGRGVVAFTPKPYEKYRLCVKNQHTGAMRTWDLPASRPGATITALKPVYPFNEPITVELLASADSPRTPGYIILRKRDKQLDKVECNKSTTQYTLKAEQAEGVLIATLYATDDSPIAERLLFRAPERQLNIAFEVLSTTLTPRREVKCRITTRDDKGTPVGALVGLTVTDASVLAMIDKREQAPRLPEMVYLENEVRSFADAADYFNPDDASAPQKIDLLLGTQGWRRFVEVRRKAIADEYPDALKRILAEKIVWEEHFIQTTPEHFMRRPRMMRAANDLILYAAAPAAVEEAVAVDGANEAQLLQEAPDAPLAPVAKMRVERNMDVAQNECPRIDDDYVWERVYAHSIPKDVAKNAQRTDFTETIYWNVGAATDPRTGVFEFSFALPDTIGSFAVMADGFANNGMLGRGDAQIVSIAPFNAEVKLPPFLTVGDEIALPIMLANNTDQPLVGVNCIIEVPSDALLLVQQPAISGTLAPGERRRVIANIKVLKAGKWSVGVRALAGTYTDYVVREVTTLSRLFPVSFNTGARITSDAPMVSRIAIPDGVENGSQHVNIQVYMSPEATMTAALNALLKRPHGCFEQTSSTNYPLVMAQQYFLSHGNVNSEVIAKVSALLDEGYKRLVSFECSKKGYEWFGHDPGHEALTAYGLMEFADMAKIMPINQTMFDNTRNWLLSRRDGNGGFQRDKRALDHFGYAPPATTDAYIVWALLECGEKPEVLRKEIDAVCKKAEASKDSYLHALAANILCLAGEKDRAVYFADALVRAQLPSGEISGVIQTITYAYGESKELEGAGLAAMAWMRCGAQYTAAIERTMSFIAERCKNGRFGSTQSTILALKAINLYDSTFAKPVAHGSLQLFLDDKPFGDPVAFDDKTTGIVRMPDCGLALTPGEHTLALKMTDGCKLSASLEVEMMTTKPDSQGTIVPTIALSSDKCVEGTPVSLQVTVRNTGNDDANMPLAVIAIPGGLEVRNAQLQELRAAGHIASYELRDNAVVLYWRGMRAGEEITLPISTIAAIPGKFCSAASRAYRYYTDEDVQYVSGVSIEVQPR